MSDADNVIPEPRLAERDAEAFKALVIRHSAMVYATCRRIIGNDAEAENVAQECFEALAQIEQAPAAYIGPWLHHVATSLSLKRARADRRRRDRDLRQAAGRGGHAELAWNDIYGYVDEVIAELPEKLRAPLIARFLQNESHAAIAQAIGVSRRTVIRRIEKGIERVRISLKRRGVPVATSTLTIMMDRNLSEAALVPASLTAELEKLALSGPTGPVGAAQAIAAQMPAITEGTAVGKKLAVGVIVVTVAVIGLWLGARSYMPLPRQPPGGDISAPKQLAGSAVGAETADLPPSAPEPKDRRESAQEARVSLDAVSQALPEMDAEAVQGMASIVMGRVIRADTRQPITRFQVGYLAGARQAPPHIILSKNPRLEPVRDEAGRFRLQVAEPGDVTVVAVAPGFVPAVQVVTDIAPTGTTAGIVIQLVPGAVVEGTVINAAGARVADALILERPFDIPPRPAEAAARSGPDGAFYLDSLPLATWMIGAYHPDYAPGWAEVLPDRFRPARVTVVVSQGGSIEGRVTSRGQPLSGHDVEVDYSVGGVFGRFHALTGPDGTYRITRLPGGNPRVSAFTTIIDGYPVSQWAIVEEGGVTVVDFNFEEDAAIEGTLLLDGRPWVQASITAVVISADGAVQDFHTRTNSDGYYVLESLPAGAAFIKVREKGENGEQAFVRTFEITAGELTRHDINISGWGGGLVCRIIAPPGNEVFYAAVSPGDISTAVDNLGAMAQVGALAVAEPEVGDDGIFRLDGLEPGTYTIFAIAVDSRVGWTNQQDMIANSRFNTAVVEVIEGEEVSVDLSLE